MVNKRRTAYLHFLCFLKNALIIFFVFCFFIINWNLLSALTQAQQPVPLTDAEQWCVHLYLELKLNSEQRNPKAECSQRIPALPTYKNM